MRRIPAIICALALLVTLASCGAPEAPVETAVPTPAETAVPTSVPTPAPTPEPTPDRTPVLSSGAEKTSALSAPFLQDEEGYIYTGLCSGTGYLNYLNDILPGSKDYYISSFRFSDDGVYAACKDGYFSLEPSVLRLYPNGGSPIVIAGDLSADGKFVLAGNCVLYRRYTDDSLVRIDLNTGRSETSSESIGSFLAAADGFFYYSKADGVYRNDSTLTAEMKLFDTNISYLCVDETGMCDLTQEGSESILEFRALDGTLLARAQLPEPADNIYYHEGRVYVPQPGLWNIQVFDMATWEVLEPIVLTKRTYGYVVVQYVSGSAIYYETAENGEPFIYRTPLGGGEAEIVGYLIL